MASYDNIIGPQSNLMWGETFKINKKAPAIANRLFDTYAKALAFANDVSATGTAIPGLQLSVYSDTDSKKNGIYRIVSVATAEGADDAVIEKVGSGLGTQVADNYASARTLATAENIGQIIYAKEDYEESGTTFASGAYIVTGNETLQKLAQSTASGDYGSDIQALQGRVSNIEAVSAGTRLTTVEGKFDDYATSADTVAAIETAKVAAEGAASAYTDEQVAELSGNVETKLGEYATSADTVAAIETAQAAAEGAASAYTDEQVAELSGNVETKLGEYANSADTVAAIETAQAAAEGAASAYTDEQIAALSGNLVSVEEKFADYATSANTVQAINDAKVAAEGAASAYTDEQVAELSGNVVTKFADYATSADTVAAIETAKNEAVSASVVTVEKLSDAESGYAASYVVKQNGSQVGATINIPKDFLVKSGEVKEVTVADSPVTGYAVGDKYIDFVVNSVDGDAEASHIYLLVSDLVDVYTGSDYITVESDNSIVLNLSGLTEQLKTDLADTFGSKSDVDNLKAISADTRLTAVEGKFDEYATSANTVQAINDAKVAAIGEASAYTDGQIVALSGNVETKLGEYANSADTVAAISTAEENAKAYASSYTETKIADYATSADTVAAIETAKVAAEGAASAYTDGQIVALSGDVETALGNKVDKVEGMSLIADSAVTKLDGIESGAQVNVIEEVVVNGVTATTSGKVASVTIDAGDIAYSGETKIDSVLEGILNRLSGVEDNKLSAITASNSGITVTSGSNVSLKLETATSGTVSNGHIELKVNSDGELYGQMYYIEDED